MKLGDGLFLNTCKRIAEQEYGHTGIKFDSMIVDNTSMQLVSKPQQFDVMVMVSHSVIQTAIVYWRGLMELTFIAQRESDVYHRSHAIAHETLACLNTEEKNALVLIVNSCTVPSVRTLVPLSSVDLVSFPDATLVVNTLFSSPDAGTSVR